jgi:putative copper export protein
MPLQDTFQSIAFSVTRFTSFSANALIFGVVPIAILVLRPSFLALDREGWLETRRRLAKRLEDLVQACLVASATATLIGILLQMAILAGESGELTMESFTAFASTPFGRAYLIRLPLLAGLTVLLLNRVEESALALSGEEKSSSKAWWGGWLALGTVLVATSSFSGHAAVGRPMALSVGNDIVHLLSGAIWFTGIIVLAALVPWAWKRTEEGTRLELMIPVVVRFSNVALITITIVAITGVVNSLFDVAELNDLVDSGYGLALSIKLAVFLGVLALGGINHFYVRRKLEHGRADGSVAALFKKTIAIELALGLSIMGATGVLTGMEKTRDSAGAAEVVATSLPLL